MQLVVLCVMSAILCFSCVGPFTEEDDGKDLYDVLGLPHGPASTQHEIRQRFAQIKSGDPPEWNTWMRMRRGYNVLSVLKSKEAYDKFQKEKGSKKWGEQGSPPGSSRESSGEREPPERDL